MADETGANVVNAVATLRRLAVEVSAMLAEVERSLLDASLPFAVISEGAEPIWSTDRMIAVGSLLTCEVRERRAGRGRPSRLGHLSVLVDVGRDGGPAEAANRPCVVVAWSTPGDPWTQTLTDGDFWPMRKDDYAIVHERLLLWVRGEDRREDGTGSPDWARRAWLHLVPLYAVARAEDVRRLLLRPFSRLLAGHAPEDVFAAPDASMRVAWRDDGTLGFAPAPE